MIPKIVNINSKCDLNTNLDLHFITNNSIDVIYNPSNFRGVIKRLRNPKTTLLIFHNGKIVITGAATVSDSKLAVKKLMRQLKRIGINCRLSGFDVSNVVATVDLRDTIKKKTGTVIDLSKLSKLNLNVFKFQPERFSALTTDINGVKAVIFHNGKVNFTGAKNILQIYETFDSLITLLLDNNLIEI